MNNIKNVIIQAGGKGTRLKTNTINKPKCLVPVKGKPLLQYSLERFKDCDIYIIGDYKYKVLKNYIDCFYTNYNITLIKAKGSKTCSGIGQAAKLIKNTQPVCLIWSDLILETDITHDNKELAQIYTSNEFNCRYKFENQIIKKEKTSIDGIIGLFTFKNKVILENVPNSGSFVGEWLSNESNLELKKVSISKVKEIGTVEELNKNNKISICRFFNSVKILNEGENKFVYKRCKIKEYDILLEKEKKWYLFAQNARFNQIPKIFSSEKYLKMSFIEGQHCHQKNNWTIQQKTNIIKNICNTLSHLHNLGVKKSCHVSLQKVYEEKTFSRIEKIKNLIPFFSQSEIIINNKINKNPFHSKYKKQFIDKIRQIQCKSFHPIHGDCTFSNLLIDSNHNVFLIDPRGTFGNSEIFGDTNYDWAKLFYSMIGNYDSINTKSFNLEITKNSYNYKLKSSGFESFESLFFKLSQTNKNEIYLINSLIWFSLCGYVIEDYDSILIAFLKGVEIWNKI